MNGIVINIDPVLLRLGSFELRWYSLTIVLAIAVATMIWVRRGRKRGINSDDIYSMALVGVIAAIVGARLVHVIDHWEHYSAVPGDILQFQQGGLAIWGGLAIGGAAVVLYSRLKHIPLGRLADALAPGLLAAHMIGRIGCIINGDAYGGITDLPWAFIYTHPGAMIPTPFFGVPTHPYPVYEIIWNGLALALVLWIDRRYRKDGLAFLSYLSVYSLGRFVLTFVRQENITLWGMQQAQVIALLVFLASLAGIIYILRMRRPAEEPA